MIISINAVTGLVGVDETFLSRTIDISNLDPEVSLILYDTETNKGTKFFGEAAIVDGYLKPEETFYGQQDISQYVTQVLNQKQAKENPVYYFRTQTNPENPDHYIGSTEEFSEYPQPTSPPEGFTDQVPPNAVLNPNGIGNVSGYDTVESELLQWANDRWYFAPFPVGSDITIAKQLATTFLKSVVNKLINNQLRNYSFYDIIEGGKTLEPADSKSHGHATMDDYIQAINATIAARLSTIGAATSLTTLYDLSYDVDDITV